MCLSATAGSSARVGPIGNPLVDEALGRWNLWRTKSSAKELRQRRTKVTKEKFLGCIVKEFEVQRSWRQVRMAEISPAHYEMESRLRVLEIHKRVHCIVLEEFSRSSRSLVSTPEHVTQGTDKVQRSLSCRARRMRVVRGLVKRTIMKHQRGEVSSAEGGSNEPGEALMASVDRWPPL
jgi:hypothetical protein